MTEVREAREGECPEVPRFGEESVVLAAFEDGSLSGHLALSRCGGNTFGHSTRYWGRDRRGAAMLWLRAREIVRIRGWNPVHVHVVPGETVQAGFWERRGFSAVTTVMRGDV